jgi:hypothetical protein
MKPAFMLLGIWLGAPGPEALASLAGYTGTDGNGLVYSSQADVTWTRDANLLGSLESTFGYGTVVDAIIAASPTVVDTPNGNDTPPNSGRHAVTRSDFASGGMANWFGAQAFTGYLNSIGYGGNNRWRLPDPGNGGQPGVNVGASDFGRLFYTELNGTARSPLPASDALTNVQFARSYWSGPDNPLSPASLPVFFANTGTFAALPKYYPSVFVWPVSSGLIATVPVPASVWLMGSALLGAFGRIKARRVGR